MSDSSCKSSRKVNLSYWKRVPQLLDRKLWLYQIKNSLYCWFLLNEEFVAGTCSLVHQSWGVFHKDVHTLSLYVWFSRTNPTHDARHYARQCKGTRAQRNPKQCNSSYVRSVRGFYNGLTGRMTHRRALWKTPQVTYSQTWWGSSLICIQKLQACCPKIISSHYEWIILNQAQ